MRVRLTLAGFLLLIPSLALAQGSSDRVLESIDPRCMQRAVEDRDNALVVASNSYNDNLMRILRERKDGVIDGWGLSDDEQQRASIRKAWSKYQKALSKAKQKRAAAVRESWKLFDRNRTFCGQAGLNTDEPGTMQNDLQW